MSELLCFIRKEEPGIYVCGTGRGWGENEREEEKGKREEESGKREGERRKRRRGRSLKTSL